jgi:hypothetical protein
MDRVLRKFTEMCRVEICGWVVRTFYPRTKEPGFESRSYMITLLSSSIFGEGESTAGYTSFACPAWHRNSGTRISVLHLIKDEAIKDTLKWLAQGHKRGGPWHVSNPRYSNHETPLDHATSFTDLGSDNPKTYTKPLLPIYVRILA